MWNMVISLICIKVKNKILFFLTVAIMASCQKDSLSDINDILYVRRNGADMPAYIYGNASDKTFLIFLHGGPGGSGLQLRSLNACQNLETTCAMVYWDQRGQGMSQGHYSQSENSVEEMAKDVKALALVIKSKYGQDSKLFLIGASWGGTLGSKVMVTEDFQYLFNGWIELEGGHDTPVLYRGGIKQFKWIADEQIKNGNSVDYWNGVLKKVNNIDTLNNDKDYCFNSFYILNQEAYTAESVLMNDGVVAKGSESLSRGLLYVYVYENRLTINTTAIFTSKDLEQNDNLSYSYSVTDQLHNIEIPTLLIWGKYDMVASPELGRTAYNMISSQKKKLVILEKSGHQSIISQPDEIVNEIVQFINENK